MILMLPGINNKQAPAPGLHPAEKQKKNKNQGGLSKIKNINQPACVNDPIQMPSTPPGVLSKKSTCAKEKQKKSRNNKPGECNKKHLPVHTIPVPPGVKQKTSSSSQIPPWAETQKKNKNQGGLTKKKNNNKHICAHNPFRMPPMPPGILRKGGKQSTCAKENERKGKSNS